MATCGYCGTASVSVRCPLCDSSAYCSRKHQLEDLIARHRDECSFRKLNMLPGLLHMSKHMLRTNAANALASDPQAALMYATAGLRAQLYDTGLKTIGVDAVGDLILFGKALVGAGHLDTASALFGMVSEALLVEPAHDTSSLFDWMNAYCEDNGMLDAVEKVQESTYAWLEKTNQASSEKGVHVLSSLAKTYLLSCKFADALKVSSRAAAIAEEFMSGAQLSAANTQRVLKEYQLTAYVAIFAGDATAAENIATKALRTSKQSKDGESMHIATQIAVAVGLALAQQRNLNGALTFLTAAFEERELWLGADHPETINARKHMNRIRKVLGQSVIPGPKAANDTEVGRAPAAPDTLPDLLASLLENSRSSNPTETNSRTEIQKQSGSEYADFKQGNGSSSWMNGEAGDGADDYFTAHQAFSHSTFDNNEYPAFDSSELDAFDNFGGGYGYGPQSQSDGSSGPTGGVDYADSMLDGTDGYFQSYDEQLQQHYDFLIGGGDGHNSGGFGPRNETGTMGARGGYEELEMRHPNQDHWREDMLPAMSALQGASGMGAVSMFPAAGALDSWAAMGPTEASAGPQGLHGRGAASGQHDTAMTGMRHKLLANNDAGNLATWSEGVGPSVPSLHGYHDEMDPTSSPAPSLISPTARILDPSASVGSSLLSNRDARISLSALQPGFDGAVGARTSLALDDRTSEPRVGYGPRYGSAGSDKPSSSGHLSRARSEVRVIAPSAALKTSPSTTRKPEVSSLPSTGIAVPGQLLPIQWGGSLGLSSIDTEQPHSADAVHFTSDNEAMSHLSKVADKLSHAVASLSAIAPGPRTARWQGDGEMAIPDADVVALEGKQLVVSELQRSLKEAIGALSATEMSLNDGVPSDEVCQLRDVLFSLVGQAAKAVDGMLQNAGVNLTRLDQFAAMSNRAGNRGNGAQAGGHAGGETGVHQPGLYKQEENIEGRRMKAVFMTGEEILSSLQSRMLSLGLFRSLGTKRRQARIAFRTFSLGCMLRAIKSRKAVEQRVKLFSVGMLQRLLLLRKQRIVALKAMVVGCSRGTLIARCRRMLGLRMFALGILSQAHKLHRSGLLKMRVFALALGPLMLRTKGNPSGYKYGRKYEPPKGPKVKQIFWDTISDVKDTLWGAPTKTTGKEMKELFGDLQDRFFEKDGAKAKATPRLAAHKKEGDADGKEAEGSINTEGPKAPAKPKPIEFVGQLDGKRAYQMNISLSKFKRFEGGFAALKQKLIEMDLEGLGGLEAVEVLETWKPTGDEIERAKEERTKLDAAIRADPIGPHADFGYIEEYIWQMTQVPRLPPRLESIRLKATFDDAYAVEERNISTLQAACDEIFYNKKLVEFLVDIVKPFGNALNKGTKKAGAKGIKISGLMKLAQTKTVDNAMTSLFYLVSVMAKHRPYLLDLCIEFKACKDAQRIQRKTVSAALQQMRANVTKMETQLQLARDQKDSHYVDVMSAFVSRMGMRVTDLNDSLDKVDRDFERVTRYMGEDPTVIQSDEFFTSWCAFIDVLTVTVNDYRRQTERAEKAAQQAALAKAKAEAKTPKPGVVDAAISPPPGPRPPNARRVGGPAPPAPPPPGGKPPS